VDELIAFLRDLPLLADIDNDTLTDAVGRGQNVRLLAGDWLFRQGDRADSLYFVRSGRLEVLHEAAGQETVICLLGRGAAVGELAVLTGSARSRSVRAVREAEVVRIDKASFEALLHGLPAVGMRLTRALAEQLQSDDRPGFTSPSEPSTIALVVPDGAGDVVLPALEQSLSPFGRVARLVSVAAGAPEARGRTLDDVEMANDMTILLATPTDPADWRQFCFGQADHLVVALEPGGAPASAALAAIDRPTHVVYLSASVGADERRRLLGALRARSQHLVRFGDGQQSPLDGVARRIMGRSLGVVLSAGGARAFAQIGVIEVLLDAGIDIDRLGGCSMGAFIAALFAKGLSAPQVIEICRRELAERSPFNDYTLPRVALLRARKAQRMLERVFGATRFEDLPNECFSVSCDLVTARVVVHRSGPLIEGVGASMSIPGLVPPFHHDGGFLVDGGVLNAMPVDVMAAEPGPVVAVDVMGEGWEPRTTSYEARPIEPGWRTRVRHLTGRGSDRLPKIGETLARTSVLGSWRMAEENRRSANVLIAPDVGRTSVLDFERLDEMVELGRNAARAAIDDVKALTANGQRTGPLAARVAATNR
jgi:predicted acylesterase/phospholipase RssA